MSILILLTATNVVGVKCKSGKRPLEGGVVSSYVEEVISLKESGFCVPSSFGSETFCL